MKHTPTINVRWQKINIAYNSYTGSNLTETKMELIDAVKAELVKNGYDLQSGKEDDKLLRIVTDTVIACKKALSGGIKTRSSKNIFSVSWADWEESGDHIFYHESKTLAQFEKDFHSLLVKYGQEYLKRERGYASVFKWVDFVASRMKELGYKKTYIKGIGFYGQPYIGMDENHPETEFMNIVGEDLYMQAVRKNKAL